MATASTSPESSAWSVAPISSNQTILVPCGAIFGTVASSSVARVMPMRLPTRSAGAFIAIALCPEETVERAAGGPRDRREGHARPPCQQRRDAAGRGDLHELDLGTHVLGHLPRHRDI